MDEKFRCPSCSISVPVELGEIAEILARRFAENCFCITTGGLKAFIDLFFEHFGEVGEDDVDLICDFVRDRFGDVEVIGEEHIKAYFAGFE
jgi:hypothetical protein